MRTLGEVRGAQPFQARLEWLQKQLVLAGTGGMLTMLSEPAGIGGGASGTQEGVWDTIVRRAAHKVEGPLNAQYDRRALAARFPGRPALAQFALRTRQERDVGSAVRNIAALAAAGFRVSPEQVAAETGYEVTAANAPAPQPAFAANAAHGPRPAARGGRNPADALLAEVAAAVLDGSVPYEEALRRAGDALAAADPALLAGGLEKSLERAMFAAAAEAAGRTEITQAEADRIYEEMMSR